MPQKCMKSEQFGTKRAFDKKWMSVLEAKQRESFVILTNPCIYWIKSFI